MSLPAEVLDDGPRRTQRLIELRDRLDASAEIRRTAFVSVLPGRGAGGWPVRFADAPDPDRSSARTAMIAVTPEFFAIAGAPAVRGRQLTWQDDHRAPLVAVVNESFAARHSAGRDPIGRGLRAGARVFEIVGVVPDLLMQDVEDPGRRYAFDGKPKPFARFSFAWLNERELPEAVRRMAAAR